MHYVISASRGPDFRFHSSEGEAAALDLINHFVATGFRIEKVTEEGDRSINPMVLLDRLYGLDQADENLARAENAARG